MPDLSDCYFIIIIIICDITNNELLRTAVT